MDLTRIEAFEYSGVKEEKEDDTEVQIKPYPTKQDEEVLEFVIKEHSEILTLELRQDKY